MQGDAQVIEVLNEVLTAELTAINQYFIHAMMCRNWHYERLAKHSREESVEEMKHAQELIDRVLYLGGGTKLQRACGFEDTPEDMFAYLMASVGDTPDEAKTRLYCEGSAPHYDWLLAQGVPFKDSMYKGKHVLQPTDECLIWSGNEEVWPYRDHARPAPRGHKVAQVGEHGGARMMEVLIARAAIKLPPLLVLDEPTSGLDPGNRARALALVESLCTQRLCTVLMVTHRPDERAFWAERVGGAVLSMTLR